MEIRTPPPYDEDLLIQSQKASKETTLRKERKKEKYMQVVREKLGVETVKEIPIESASKFESNASGSGSRATLRDRYKVGGLLGVGAFGVVVLVQDKET